MTITTILNLASVFCANNGFTIKFDSNAKVIAENICHDALHQILGLDLHTADEFDGDQDECDWANEEVEDEVLMIHKCITRGMSLTELQSDFADFDGITNLTEEVREVMYLFFN